MNEKKRTQETIKLFFNTPWVMFPFTPKLNRKKVCRKERKEPQEKGKTVLNIGHWPFRSRFFLVVFVHNFFFYFHLFLRWSLCAQLFLNTPTILKIYYYSRKMVFFFFAHRTGRSVWWKKSVHKTIEKFKHIDDRTATDSEKKVLWILHFKDLKKNRTEKKYSKVLVSFLNVCCVFCL